MKLTQISDELSKTLSGFAAPAPVAYTYDPTEYARAVHQDYLERYGVGPRGRVLLMGMNPGPWGMAQTGVPFGEVSAVRDWMKLKGEVRKPDPEHPKRPVDGFECPRSEVSGARLWGWAQERFEVPEAFFARFFVWNYCPLSFMEEGGRNFTPDKLPAKERDQLYDACDVALRRLVESLEPSAVVGVGAFAEKRARAALGDSAPPIGRILHPSPASPIANRGWADRAEVELAEMGIDL